MPEKPREEKSREIAEAARRYVYNRLRPLLVVLPAVIAVCWVTSLLAHDLMAAASGSDPLLFPGDSKLCLVLRLCSLAILLLLAVKAVAWLRGGGWSKLEHWMEREAGVAVEYPRHLPRWQATLLSALLGAVIPVLAFGTFSVMLRSPAKLQPLEGALLALALTAAKYRVEFLLTRDPDCTLLRNPVRLVGTATLLIYGLAVAAGLRQPWANLPAATRVSAALGAFLRGMLPMLLALVVDAFGRQLYSHRQFRRLQRLVNEDPPAEEHHGAD